MPVHKKPSVAKKKDNLRDESASHSAGEEFSDDQEDEGDYKKGGYHCVRVGERFKNGQYVVQRKLGWGHFSTVWAVEDSATGTVSAMKVVKSAAHYTEAARDEVLLLSAITKHDPDDAYGCVRLLDSFDHIGPHGRHVCMVFEVLGDNLLSLIRLYNHRGIPLAVVRALTRQMLTALAHLHDVCGIIHTDIKPENVMLKHPIKPKAPRAAAARRRDGLWAAGAAAGAHARQDCGLWQCLLDHSTLHRRHPDAPVSRPRGHPGLWLRRVGGHVVAGLHDIRAGHRRLLVRAQGRPRLLARRGPPGADDRAPGPDAPPRRHRRPALSRVLHPRGQAAPHSEAQRLAPRGRARAKVQDAQGRGRGAERFPAAHAALRALPARHRRGDAAPPLAAGGRARRGLGGPRVGSRRRRQGRGCGGTPPAAQRAQREPQPDAQEIQVSLPQHHAPWRLARAWRRQGSGRSRRQASEAHPRLPRPAQHQQPLGDHAVGGCAHHGLRGGLARSLTAVWRRRNAPIVLLLSTTVACSFSRRCVRRRRPLSPRTSCFVICSQAIAFYSVTRLIVESDCCRSPDERLG